MVIASNENNFWLPLNSRLTDYLSTILDFINFLTIEILHKIIITEDIHRNHQVMNRRPLTIFCPVDWDYVTLHACVEMVYSIRCQRKATAFVYTFRFNAIIGYGPGDRDFTFRLPIGARDFYFLESSQTGTVAYPAFYSISMSGGFPRGDAISA